MVELKKFKNILIISNFRSSIVWTSIIRVTTKITWSIARTWLKKYNLIIWHKFNNTLKFNLADDNNKDTGKKVKKMKKRMKELIKRWLKGNQETHMTKRGKERENQKTTTSQTWMPKKMKTKEDDIEVNNINRRQMRRLKLKKTRKVTLITRKIYLRFYHTKNYLFLPAVMMLGNYMSYVCMYCHKKYF